MVQSGGTGEGTGSAELSEVLKTVENIKVTCTLVICCFNIFACLVKCCIIVLTGIMEDVMTACHNLYF